MRGDMPKVIVERPRLGSGGKRLRRDKTVREDDAALSKIGMKRDARLRGGYKTLNENLSPLKRYLEAQVDRPWRKVWSEICANLKPSNTVQQHVRDHIPDFIAIKTSLRDGEVFVHERWRGGPVRLKDSHVRLFVDPASGLVRRNKHWRSWEARRRVIAAAEAKAREAWMRVVSDKVQLHLYRDCWWEVTLAGVPKSVELVETVGGVTRRVTYERPVDDVLLRKGGTAQARQSRYGRAGVYAAAKRQLTTKEIRALGLS
jgi:hypothetical protein